MKQEQEYQIIDSNDLNEESINIPNHLRPDNGELYKFMLESTPLIEELENTLKGKKPVQGENNTIVWIRPEEIEEGLLPDQMVDMIVASMRFILSPQVVLGNLEKDGISKTCHGLMTEFSNYITLSFMNYPTIKKQHLGIVMQNVSIIIESNLSRAWKSKTFQNMSTSMQHNEQVVSDGKNKGWV
jgi:hypothetical protein|tara:strand:+ start:561 stop:1115 length:555 start_codon:yes stop_codon:yes gene_type:complete